MAVEASSAHVKIFRHGKFDACLEGSFRVVLEFSFGHVAEVAISMAGSEKDKLAALLNGAIDRVPNKVDALLGDKTRHTGHQGLVGVNRKAQALLQVPDANKYRSTENRSKSVSIIDNQVMGATHKPMDLLHFVKSRGLRALQVVPLRVQDCVV